MYNFINYMKELNEKKKKKKDNPQFVILTLSVINTNIFYLYSFVCLFVCFVAFYFVLCFMIIFFFPKLHFLHLYCADTLLQPMLKNAEPNLDS